jgi:DNA-binding response OmpR family regulator
METKILLVEDEENIRKLVASYLVKEGFKVVEAADGEEAIEKFDNEYDFSLIILDVMMPKMDGYQVASYIRKDYDVPILMLTARDAEIDEITGFNSGADEYISKPFSPRILVARVKKPSKKNCSKQYAGHGIRGISR